MKYIKSLKILTLTLVLSACVPDEYGSVKLVDSNATQQTKALFVNLDQIRHDYVLFGHQDTKAYGVKWRGDENRSDIKDVTGSFPAIYGWDLGHLELGSEENLDKVNFNQMREWIIDAYERGGVTTLSWHLNHPVTGNRIPEEHNPDEWEAAGSSWDNKPVINDILPGGSHEEVFNEWLDNIAGFFHSLESRTGDKYLIPIIFRPWHEVTGFWFWWGSEAVTPEEYIRLWRYTVESLRDERGVHNLLYAYTPNTFNELDNWEDFWKWYPGDDYVDIIGFDDYYTLQGGYGDEAPVEMFTSMLKYLVEESEARGKIPVLGETGLEAISIHDWYTSRMLKAIKGDPAASRIAYLLVWRNANEATDRTGHFYGPYVGHPSAEDFVKFHNDPKILLENDLPDMYSIPGNK